MPRPKTEATVYLDIYKLVSERKRLRQELDTIEQRRDYIQKRLGVLDNQVADLEQNLQKLRDTNVSESKPAIQVQVATDDFDTFHFEY